jgi:hypothetical protein
MNPLTMILNQPNTRFSTNFVMGNHVTVGLLQVNMLLSIIIIKELCSHDVSQIGVGLCEKYGIIFWL